VKITISGIRGVFGGDLTPNDVIKYCNNFTTLVKSKKCVIGYDTRPSSNIMMNNVVASLMQCGIDVYNLGMVPTPVVFRESRKYGAGVMITSSHNPIEWNGLKFIIDGRGLNENELNTIKNNQPINKSKIGTEKFIESNYVIDAINLVGSIKENPKVVLDIGGGAAKNVAPEILQKIGCDIKILNETQSNRGPDPTTDSLSDLTSECNKNQIGFAYDLDGDRVVIVKNGKKLSPDTTLGLGIAKAIELGCKKFVLSIDTSIAIEKYIKQNGCNIQRSKVGEANVVDLMLQTNSEAGGEGSSAGFILSKFNFCRDGILTSALASSMLESKRFEDVIDLINGYYQFREKVKIESKFHDKIMNGLKQNLQNKFGEISIVDGIKAIIDENSWVLVRKSNTEDSIRISCESNNLEKTKQIQHDMIELVKQSYAKIK